MKLVVDERPGVDAWGTLQPSSSWLWCWGDSFLLPNEVSSAPILWRSDGSGWWQGACTTLSCVWRGGVHYVFVSFVFSFSFGSALSYMAGVCSAKIDWSSFDTVHRWFHTLFLTGVYMLSLRVYFVTEDISAWTARGRWTLCCSGCRLDGVSPQQYSLENTNTYICLPSQGDPEVDDRPSASLGGPDVYKVVLYAKGEWALLDILLSDKIQVCSSLQVYFTVIHGRLLEYSVEAPKTASGVLNLALWILNTLREQQELLAELSWFCNSIHSSMADMQSLQR